MTVANQDTYDCDVAIIGSGFGGSVSALRLAEKGYRVIVLEQGRRVGPSEIEEAATNLRRFVWAPSLGMDGYFSQVLLKHVSIARGVAVGGGSIVYAAVLLHPDDGHGAFFSDPAWARLGLDWRAELAPHYATAKRMLGVTECPTHGRMDDYLEATARAMGAHESFGSVPLGVYFGDQSKRGETRDDPFFGGRGPQRTTCRSCGECLGGCPHGSKNSLDKNYLYLAEQLGAEVRPRHRVDLVRPLDDAAEGGYEVRASDPLGAKRPYAPIRARKVILAAGAIGSMELLFKCRDEHRTLPAVSQQLGQVVRTNSEAIVSITGGIPAEDLSDGPAVSTHFYANEHTHITNNRFPQAFEFLKYQVGPLVDGEHVGRRALSTLLAATRHPGAATVAMRARAWHKGVSVLTVMQDLDNQLRFTWGPRLGGLAGRGLRSERIPGRDAPAYIPEANDAARAFAAASGGVPGNALTESLLGASTTAHIMGGCHMGRDPSEGVVDSDHCVFGYPGLYVADGSVMSANVGVNPSLTITAMTERFIAGWPEPR